jgi:quinol monooxygenase YgiN
MSFAVIVTFKVHNADIAAFMPLMVKQAKNSLELEPACRIFEIWQHSGDENTVKLYEVYDDAAAFQAHLDSDYFKAFDKVVASMIAHRNIERLDRKIELD